jgi:chorismate mutase / prephenate dehydratase
MKVPGIAPYPQLAEGRTVHFLGPAGTFANAAALKAFGERASLVPQSDILAVFEAVELDPKALGVVPIENSTEGGVNLTAEALVEYGNQAVIGEVIVDVEQCLLGRGPLESVDTVFSHSHGLAQCKHWLRDHLPKARPTVVSSTAAGATLAAETPNSAAIASELAGELAGVPVLVRGVQDRALNATRFLILGRDNIPPSGSDKTSLVFVAPHRRGALHSLLGILVERGINLSRIESRPMPGRLWHYFFFVDIEGHRSEPHVAQALSAVAEQSSSLRILGSYPAATIEGANGPSSV